MIKENDYNEIHKKEVNYTEMGNIDINQESNLNDKNSAYKLYNNSIIICNSPENNILKENDSKKENSVISYVQDNKDHDTKILIQEEKSSIFNSKNLMNKSELEHFYEQNNYLHMSSIYDDHIHSSDELQNLMIYDEKVEFKSKSSSKIAIPINRNSEKPSKRKKNMNNLRREIDTPLTHSIFEKNEKIEEAQIREEVIKYPYNPLNKEKEEKLDKYCEQ